KYVTGNLLQLGSTTNNTNIGTQIQKANLTGKTIRTGVNRGDLDPNNPDIRWFNYGTANTPFVNAPAYTLGTAAIFQNDFRNPPMWTDNYSVMKTFAVWERVTLKYRADAFNAFNRSSFGGVNGTVENPNFGRVTAMRQSFRMITMGLRLEW
ncbi:MAG TPA: hypothetical protein VN442_26380, partial [Bryobacteraceae bacterium]|nr:hypothetical protein [Bryobacteraceae bacterium]